MCEWMTTPAWNNEIIHPWSKSNVSSVKLLLGSRLKLNLMMVQHVVIGIKAPGGSWMCHDDDMAWKCFPHYWTLLNHVYGNIQLYKQVTTLFITSAAIWEHHEHYRPYMYRFGDRISLEFAKAFPNYSTYASQSESVSSIFLLLRSQADTSYLVQ